MKNLLGPVLVSLLALPAATMSQGLINNVSKTGTVAAPFLEIPVGPAAVAMGNAFVSLSNDASALYWNPSGLATLEQGEVLAAHTSWIANTRFDFAALALPLGGFGSLGLSITSLSMDDMKVTTVDKPDGTGEFFSAGDIAAGLSYSRELTDRFTIGFTAKYIQQTIWHESANAFALDVGTLFRTDLIGGMTIGASLSNFGTPMQMTGRDTRQFGRIDPTKEGTNGQIPEDIETDSWDLPLLFQIGVSTSPIKTDTYRLTVAMDALHPNDNYESVNAGGEFAYQNFLFLRGGYNALFLPDAEGGLSLGFGISSSSFLSGSTQLRFDYAYRDMGRLESIHVFALDVRF